MGCVWWVHILGDVMDDILLVKFFGWLWVMINFKFQTSCCCFLNNFIGKFSKIYMLEIQQTSNFAQNFCQYIRCQIWPEDRGLLSRDILITASVQRQHIVLEALRLCDVNKRIHGASHKERFILTSKTVAGHHPNHSFFFGNYSHSFWICSFCHI